MSEKKELSPSLNAWGIVSIAMMLLGAVGLALMKVQKISLEMILAGMFIVGVVSLVIFSVYLLVFHDIKGEC